MFDEKAQLHTLEGIIAATVMLLVLIYSIDATSLTPLTSSTANVHVESELQVLGQDILSALDYVEPGYNSSKLKTFISNWDGDRYIWSGSNYTNSTGALNRNLTIFNIFNKTLVQKGIAHNLVLTFIDNSTLAPTSLNMIYNGNPSENAVIISRKIVLHNGEMNNQTKINDIDTSSNLKNIIDVKLILWRM